jgi:hypothetical protein
MIDRVQVLDKINRKIGVQRIVVRVLINASKTPSDARHPSR